MIIIDRTLSDVIERSLKDNSFDKLVPIIKDYDIKYKGKRLMGQTYINYVSDIETAYMRMMVKQNDS